MTYKADFASRVKKLMNQKKNRNYFKSLLYIQFLHIKILGLFKIIYLIRHFFIF